MSMNGRVNVNGIYGAKSINEAIKAYNRECETCLKHGCNGEYCAATRALNNVCHKREFETEMRNSDIRKQVALALEMG